MCIRKFVSSRTSPPTEGSVHKSLSTLAWIWDFLSRRFLFFTVDIPFDEKFEELRLFIAIRSVGTLDFLSYIN